MLDEWNLLQAARWSNVAPWELARRPAVWLKRILSVMSVEAGMQKASSKKVNR